MNKKVIIACIAIAAIGLNADAQKKEKAPPPPPVQQKTISVNDKEAYDDFLKRNPTVKSLYWKGTGRTMTVRLKSGKEEVYNLENEKEMDAAVAKYGNIPEPPPPPPAKPSEPKQIEVDEPAPPADAGKPGDYLPTPPKKKLPPPPPAKKAGIA